MADGIVHWANFGRIGGRGDGLLTGGAAFYNIYRTSDGCFVTLGALEAKFWQAFWQAVDRPAWIGRQSEPLPQNALVAEVAALFAAWPRTHWQALLEPADCCFEMVLTADESRTHPQVTARGLVQQSDRRIEVLFPAYFDGQPPKAREAIVEINAVAALELWQG